MALAQEKIYTIDDIYAMPDGQRAELIDGQMYMMAPPTTTHQRLVARLSHQILNHIDAKGGNCEVFPAPFAVFLNKDGLNYVEPVIEIVSPSSTRMDYSVKLFKYRTAGVREYWIVNPMKKVVQTYVFEGEEDSNLFSFDDEIPIYIFNGLTIRISDLL